MYTRKKSFFRQNSALFLIASLSLLPLIFFFLSDKLLHTHDGLVHLPRIAAYYKALLDGQIPVRWAGDLNYNYGMPIFNFIYHTPYLVASLFLFLGVGLVKAFTLSLAASYILAGIFMFLFTNALFKDTRRALLVTVFYQFASFRLVDLVVRGSFGEVYTYAFLPLVLYGLTKLFQEVKLFYLILTAIATALLIVSHNSISLLFFGVCVLYILLFARSKQQLFFGFLSIFSGLLLAAFYWIPAVFEHKYTYGDLFMEDLYRDHFVPIQNFFIPNFMNSKSLWTEGISTQIGLFHVIALFLALYYFIKKQVTDFVEFRITLFSLIILIGSFFFMLSFSKPLWEQLALLRQFQFPWRFLALVAFATSLLSVYYMKITLLKNDLVYFGVLVVVIFSTFFYWKPSLGYKTIDENYYWNFPLTSTYYGETDLIWSGGQAKAYPKTPAEVVAGKAKIFQLSRKSNKHIFRVSALEDSKVVDHTQYFPGWRVSVDGKPTPVEFQDQNWRGEITFPVPKGDSTVSVVFGESRLRFIADIISLATLPLLLFGIYVFRKIIWNKEK